MDPTFQSSGSSLQHLGHVLPRIAQHKSCINVFKHCKIFLWLDCMVHKHKLCRHQHYIMLAKTADMPARPFHNQGIWHKVYLSFEKPSGSYRPFPDLWIYRIRYLLWDWHHARVMARVLVTFFVAKIEHHDQSNLQKEAFTGLALPEG